jgi:AcrR family transcriptional regulator
MKIKKAEAASHRETTERLLDTAEKLFAAHGYNGVGMRALAEEANVNLGAATYHYGSKEALYTETFLRRYQPMNEERLNLLRQAEADCRGKPLPVEKIVDCMIRPPFLLLLRHPHFPALLSRNLFMPPPFLNSIMHRENDPIIAAFDAAFTKSLPKLPADLLQMRLKFSMGALLVFSTKLARKPASKDPKWIESILQELVRFISAGLQGEPAVPTGERSAFPRPRPTRA